MSTSAAPFLVIVVIAIAYLLGSIPFGLLLTRAAGLGDIRKLGSGNIGATNVLRTGRKGLAAATLVLDAAKGALAVFIGLRVAGSVGVLVCGLGAVVGHLYPVWLGFRGGKGMATALGVMIAASPLSGAGMCLIWLLMAKFFRFSSAATLASIAAGPFLVALIAPDVSILILAFMVAGLVWSRHGGNIRRLMTGTEPRIGER